MWVGTILRTLFLPAFTHISHHHLPLSAILEVLYGRHGHSVPPRTRSDCARRSRTFQTLERPSMQYQTMSISSGPHISSPALAILSIPRCSTWNDSTCHFAQSATTNAWRNIPWNQYSSVHAPANLPAPPRRTSIASSRTILFFRGGIMEERRQEAVSKG